MIEISSGNYKNSSQHAGLLTLNFPRMLFHDSGHTSWIRRGNTSLYLNTPRLTSINMTAPWPFEYWTFQECYCMTLATEVVWTEHENAACRACKKRKKRQIVTILRTPSRTNFWGFMHSEKRLRLVLGNISWKYFRST